MSCEQNIVWTIVRRLRMTLKTMFSV
jgi:hypothetical protein